MRKLYLADAFGPDEDVLREASPVYHARSNAPPFLLLNASMDFGLENDSLLLRETLLGCEGNSVEHRLYAGTDHAYIIGLTFACGKAFPPLVQDVLAWLKKQVAGIQQKRLEGERHEEVEDDSNIRPTGDEATERDAGETEQPVMVLRAFGWE
jgi:hypothetical protein